MGDQTTAPYSSLGRTKLLQELNNLYWTKLLACPNNESEQSSNWTIGIPNVFDKREFRIKRSVQILHDWTLTKFWKPIL